MPSSCCVVPFCGNRGGFLFPKDIEMKKKWIQAIKRLKDNKNKNKLWTPSKWSTVCKRHFKGEDFSEAISCDGKPEKVYLKSVAVPSIFPWKKQKPADVDGRKIRTEGRKRKILNCLKKKDPKEFDTLFHKELFEYNPLENTAAFSENVKEPEVLEVRELLSDLNVPMSEEIEIELVMKEDESREINLDATWINLESMANKKDDALQSNEDESLERKNNENNMEDSKFVSVAVGTDNELQLVSIAVGSDEPITTTVNRYCQTLKRPRFDIKNIANDNVAIHFYTGLETYEKFIMVYRTLEDRSKKLKYFYGPPPRHLSTLNNFVLTLMILRRHYTFYEMKMWFDCTEKEVSNIFITWVRFMSLEWRMLPIWANREVVSFYSPTDFQDKFPNVRVTIDGTECPIQQPSLPTAQQATFSTYKNRSTVKVLVGATPGGLISFVSDSYAGSATDRQFVERSDLPEKCVLGDEILADKGFNVQDLFSPYGVRINMPHFFRKVNRLNDETLQKNKKISSKRVHIERIMQIGKTYKILKQPMNRTEIYLSSDIIFICFMLCNFRKPIMNKYC